MNHIVTFEYSSIPFSALNFTDNDLEKIEGIIDRQFKDVISIGRREVKFKQFVGILKIGDTTIEVLPKIFSKNPKININERSKIYNNFYYMIQRSLNRNYKHVNIIKSNNIGKSTTFLDIFIHFYLNDLFSNLIKGIYRTYVPKEGNIRFVKGKILKPQNMRVNMLNFSRTYCEFDEFTEDNPVNHVLKFTVKQMLKKTSWRNNIVKGRQILQLLNNVSNPPISQQFISSIKRDRMLRDYDNLLDLSELFLYGGNNTYNGLHNDKGKTFIFNLDMNKLFEDFLTSICIAEQNEIWGNLASTTLHSDKENLVYKNGKGKMPLIPDIIASKDNRVIIVVDFKYKLLENIKGKRKGVKREDLYQMFAYYKKYNPKNIFLLYPLYKERINDHYSFEEGSMNNLLVKTINLTDDFYSVQGYQQLIDQLKTIFNDIS